MNGMNRNTLENATIDLFKHVPAEESLKVAAVAFLMAARHPDLEVTVSIDQLLLQTLQEAGYQEPEIDTLIGRVGDVVEGLSDTVEGILKP